MLAGQDAGQDSVLLVSWEDQLVGVLLQLLLGFCYFIYINLNKTTGQIMQVHSTSYIYERNDSY